MSDNQKRVGPDVGAAASESRIHLDSDYDRGEFGSPAGYDAVAPDPDGVSRTCSEAFSTRLELPAIHERMLPPSLGGYGMRGTAQAIRTTSSSFARSR